MSEKGDLGWQAFHTTANTALFPFFTKTETASITSTFSRSYPSTVLRKHRSKLTSRPSMIMILHIPRARRKEWHACVCNYEQMCVLHIHFQETEIELYTLSTQWEVTVHGKLHKFSLCNDEIRKKQSHYCITCCVEPCFWCSLDYSITPLYVAVMDWTILYLVCISRIGRSDPQCWTDYAGSSVCVHEAKPLHMFITHNLLKVKQEYPAAAHQYSVYSFPIAHLEGSTTL